MHSVKAQASAEFLAIVAVGLVVVGIAAFFLFSQGSNVGARSDLDTARLSVNDIAKAADDVFVQGAGSSKSVSVLVPESSDLNASGIFEKSVFLNVAGSRVFASSKASLEGSFPQKKGQQEVMLNARADYVYIGESRVSLSKYSVFQSIIQGSESSEKISITNASDAPLSVALELLWDSEIAFVQASPSSFSIGPKQSVQFSINFSARPLALGSASGKLLVNASGNSYFESLKVPLSVEVVSSKAPTGSLRIIPSSWSVSLKQGESVSKQFKLCNQSESGASGLGLSRSEIFSKQLPRSEGGMVWSIHSDDDFVYAGMQDGSLNVWDRESLTFFKSVSETTSPLLGLQSSGRRVFAASSDGKVYVFSKDGLSLEESLDDSTSPLTSLAIDSSRVYAASSDGFLLVWDISGLSFVSRLSGSSDALNSVAADSSQIVAGGSDGNLYVWRSDGLSFDRKVRVSDSSVNSVSISGGLVFAAAQDGKVFVFDSSDFSLKNVISKPVSGARQVCASSSLGFAALAAADSGVEFFSIPEFYSTLSSSAGTFMQSVHCSGEFVFVGTNDSRVFALKYGEFVNKIAADWVEGEFESIPEVPPQGCIDLNFSITVPPLMPSSVFFGDLNIGSKESFDILQLQASVG